MGFFLTGAKKIEASPVKGASLALLHQQECLACPLNHAQGLRHPKMRPTGSAHPLVYMLGEAPGANEDAKGEQFIGVSGRLLRSRIPKKWESKIRWNNSIRCRPPENRDPMPIELECCRPFHIRDIEATKPKVIFGFGNVPLQWALGESGITKWNGRYAPIKVGTHTCWFFPMIHPSYVLHMGKDRRADEDGVRSDTEFVFALNLKRAFELVETLPEPVVHTKEQAIDGIEIITGERGETDLKRFREVLRHMASKKVVGLDYETSCLRPYSEGAKLLTGSLSSDEVTFAFPFKHRESKWSKQHLEIVYKEFGDFLHDAPCKKVSHQLAFEMEWSGYMFGPDCLWGSKWADTMSQAYILDERQGALSLDVLCQQYFGLSIKDIDNLDRKKLDWYPLETVLRYNGLDSRYHRFVYFAQAKRLQDEGMMEVYNSHYRRIPTMVLTQLQGTPVDQAAVKRLGGKYEKALAATEAKLVELDVVKKFAKLKGKDFRPSAPHDVTFMLRNILGLTIEKTDEEALAKVKHPVAKLILQWRKSNKMLSTYVKPVRVGSPHLYPDGRMHPIISTTKTRTWRTSSEDPNSQNWPKHGPNKEVREQVRGAKGYKIVSFDYAGIQARNVAMESKDKNLVGVYWERYDIHGDWTERLARKSNAWAKEMQLSDKVKFKAARQEIKNKFVFPSFFGAQPKSIGGSLHLPEQLIASLQDDFFGIFHDVHAWQKKTEQDYRERGYVTGLTGFRRHAPISVNELINAPIQADESMIVCDAMARLSMMGKEQYQAMMEIHDDLTFCWPENRIDTYAEVVVKEMVRQVIPWTKIVPLEVEMSVGDDWCHMEEVAKYSSDGGWLT